MSILELIIHLLILMFLLISLKKGILSPHFLVLLHLFLGVSIRYIVLQNELGVPLKSFLPISNQSFFEMSFFILLYVIFYYLLGINKNNINKFKTLNKGFFIISILNKRSLRKVFWITIIFLLIYFIIMSSIFGSIENFIFIKLNRVATPMQGLGYLDLLFDFAVVGSIFTFYISKKINKYKIVTNILIIVMILSLILMGGRGNLIQYIISLFIIVTAIKGERLFFDKKVITIILLFLLMSSGGLAVRKSNQLKIPITEAFIQSTKNLVETFSGPFALFDHFELSKEYVIHNKHDYGLFYLSLATRPIPRSIWKEKPQVLGKKIRKTFWGDMLGGIPAGYIGEAYISFNLLGFFLLSLLLAYIVKKLEFFYELSLINSKITVIYSLIVPYVIFNLIRTGMDTAFVRIIVMFISYLFFYLVIKYKITK